MKTRIVEREDVRSIPALSAMHGPKGFCGNQELGGDSHTASLRRSAMSMTSETFFTVGERDTAPTLKRRDYKDPPLVAYEED